MILHLTESQVAFAKLRVEKGLEATGAKYPGVEVDFAMDELESKALITQCHRAGHGRCLMVQSR